MTKTCKVCETKKPIQDFYKNSRAKDGYTSSCIECIKIRVQKRSIINKEKYKSKSSYVETPREKRRKAKARIRYDKEDRMTKSKKPKIRQRRKSANELWDEYRDFLIKTNVRAKRRRENDPLYKLVGTLRSRIGVAIKEARTDKVDSSIKLLGCSANYYRDYLESKFQDGMTWDNHTVNGWHIDHIKPLSSYDLSIEAEQYKAFHYLNTQPLWAEDNLKKGNKILT